MSTKGSPVYGTSWIRVVPLVALAWTLSFAGCDSVTQLKSACEQKQPDACATLSQMFLAGHEVPRDSVQGAEYATRACDGGVLHACAVLSTLYRIGNGVGRDEHEAARFAKLACDGGEAYGCTNLGYLCWKGIGVPQSDADAVHAFQVACDGGDPSGCVHLGYLYGRTPVLPDDMRKAAQLYAKACDAGYARGCTHLAYAYRTGHGAPYDMELSIRTARKACDLGDAAGCKVSEMYRYADQHGEIHYVRDPADAPEQFRDAVTRVGPPPGAKRESSTGAGGETDLDPDTDPELSTDGKADAKTTHVATTKAADKPAAAPVEPLAVARVDPSATAPAPRVDCNTIALTRRMFPSPAAYLDGGTRPRWREFDRTDGDGTDPARRLEYEVRDQKAVVCVPEGVEPLGVYLHIDAGDGPGLPHGWDTVLARHRLIFAAPLDAGNTKPRMRRIGLALDTLATVEEAHRIDRSRVIASGLSGGGATATKMALNYPELFSGVVSHVRFVALENLAIPGSGTLPSEAPYLTPEDLHAIASRGLRFAWITGTGDPNRAGILKSDRVWKRFGLDSRVFDLPGATHDIAPPEALEVALQWVEQPKSERDVQVAHTTK